MDILDFDFASRLLTAGTGLKFTPEKVNEALKEGASKGQVVPVGRLVKEYYKAKGWDAQGVPQD
jgi:aldehyde:ferredoxin oxidoreductase